MFTTKSESWISEFIKHVLSPTAIGDFVLTILGAAVAFAGALWLFRHQLRHDRRLSQEQIDAERSSRRAEMRRAAAHRLGMELIAASQEFGSLNNDDLHSLLEQRGFASVHERSPGANRAYAAHRFAEYELEIDNAVITVWAAKLHWWKGVQALLADERLTTLQEEHRKRMLYNLVEDRFLAFDALLHELGTSLVRWDGDGELPTISEEKLPERIGNNNVRLASETLDKVLQKDAELRSR